MVAGGVIGRDDVDPFPPLINQIRKRAAKAPLDIVGMGAYRHHYRLSPRGRPVGGWRPGLELRCLVRRHLCIRDHEVVAVPRALEKAPERWLRYHPRMIVRSPKPQLSDARPLAAGILPGAIDKVRRAVIRDAAFADAVRNCNLRVMR